MAELNDTFRRVDRTSMGQLSKESKKGPGKKEADPKKNSADKQLGLVEFNEALVRLSIKVMNVSAAGRKAVKEGKAAEGLRRLLTNYVLLGTVNEELEKMRADAESPQVAEVLNNSKPALARRFAILGKRANRPNMGKKIQLAEGNIEVETLVDDFATNKLLVDVNCVVQVRHTSPRQPSLEPSESERASERACARF